VQARRQGPGSGIGQPQVLHDRRNDEVGVGERRQRHEEHPVWEVVSKLRRHVLGQAGLADTAWAGQRDQADVLIGQEIVQTDRPCVPSNQGLDRRGEVRATSDWAWCNHATWQAAS